jgi:hypothetical protein
MGARPDDDFIERCAERERGLDRDFERERRFLRTDLRRRLNRDDIVERGLLGPRRELAGVLQPPVKIPTTRDRGGAP